MAILLQTSLLCCGRIGVLLDRALRFLGGNKRTGFSDRSLERKKSHEHFGQGAPVRQRVEDPPCALCDNLAALKWH